MNPAYGYVFEEYLKDFDYWGYCDLAEYFGNRKEMFDVKIFKSYFSNVAFDEQKRWKLEAEKTA